MRWVGYVGCDTLGGWDALGFSVSISGLAEMRTNVEECRPWLAAEVEFTTKKDVAQPTTVRLTVETSITTGGATIDLKGQGQMHLPCQHFGDLRVSIAVGLKNSGVEWLRNAEGRGLFESDCGGLMRITFEILIQSGGWVVQVESSMTALGFRALN